jgi:hypothetical protein
MKTFALLLFGATIAIIKANDFPDNADLAEFAAGDAADLGKILSDNWEVRAAGHEVTLTSKFEVFMINVAARASAEPEFSDKTPRKLLEAEAKPTKYVIHLRYEKAMPPEEYAQRRQERQKLAYRVSLGAKTKEDYVAIYDQFLKLKMPRYSGFFYEIYEENPDRRGLQMYPPMAVQKVGGAKEILRVRLNQVLTDID